MKIYLKNLDHEIAINITPSGLLPNEVNSYKLCIDNMELFLYIKKGRTKHFFSTDQKSWTAITKNNHMKQVSLNNQVFNLHVGFLPSKNAEDKEGSLVSKMPGKVVKVIKEAGEKVNLGDSILIIEAMKMENEIKANKNGIIEKVCVTSGQNINAGELLAIIV